MSIITDKFEFDRIFVLLKINFDYHDKYRQIVE